MPTPEPHSVTLRVRYGETDQGGVVYHANYIPYFEVGRTELMRSRLGVPYEEIERKSGVLLVVVDMSARFLRPALYDDLLEIRTEVSAVSGARVRFDYQIVHLERQQLLCTGSTLLGSVRRDGGRPCPLPELLRQRLQEQLNSPEDTP